MRIKQKPEDFSVKESFRFDEVESGRYRVYLMDKQKLSTFDAADRIRDMFGLKPGAISYCGLKDKQGRTEQLIAVEGADVDVQDPDLRLKYLGRTNKPLTAANITSNRFAVTVRALSPESLGPLNVAAAEVNRLGVINYFDSQRFGSLKHGQGFIAKDLIRGDFEAALRNYFAKPSELDRTEDAKVKAFWRDNWGHWDARVPYEGSRKYHRILRSLREKPGDYVRAFLQIDSAHRAMLLFTYQSYLWNEGVRRYLQLMLPREHLFPMPYQAGTLLFHRDASPEVLHALRDATFPLLGPDTTFTDPKVEEACNWILKREKITLEDLRIEEASQMLFFKSEERPLLVFPHKLVLGKAREDELNPGQIKVNVAFTLPPGAYATLVVKRLFHFRWREDTREEIYASQRPRYAEALSREQEAQEDEGPRRPKSLPLRPSDRSPSARASERSPSARGDGAKARSGFAKDRAGARPEKARTVTRNVEKESAAAPAEPLGFREQQRQKKENRARARAEMASKSAKSQKKK